MPCLLYCVAEPATAPPPRGVRGAAVKVVDVEGLRCFYSDVDVVIGDPESLKRDALDFHVVTRDLFRQCAIIPFRFPTTLDSLARLAAYLRDHASAYLTALGGFRDQVQMEIRIQPPTPPSGNSASGTAYLRQRAERAQQMEQAIAVCHAAINREVIHWRQREGSHGVRCFALIKREAVDRFQQQIQQVRLDAGVTATLSGPWPPTEFFPAFHD